MASIVRSEMIWPVLFGFVICQITNFVRPWADYLDSHPGLGAPPPLPLVHQVGVEAVVLGQHQGLAVLLLLDTPGVQLLAEEVWLRY